MNNPTIEQLRNPEEYQLITALHHDQIKEFVLSQLSRGGSLVVIYSVYQLIMILTGVWFLTRSIALALHGGFLPFLVSMGTLAFCFTLLVVIHELLHGIALKLSGAPKVNYGGYLKKFIFYAEADRFVMNRKQFIFLALTPLVVIQMITLAGAIFFYHETIFYFFILVMCVHSLFCAGDIGLMTLFVQNSEDEIFTFDVKEERRAYFYKKLKFHDDITGTNAANS